jgi:hypothetical protein
MSQVKQQLTELYDRIPRRHSPDNVKEISSIVDAYEDLLKTLEEDAAYEDTILPFFDVLDPVRAAIKNSTSSKASKKGKDVFFDEAAGLLKDSMAELMRQ